jgi:hypothetical protein
MKISYEIVTSLQYDNKHLRQRLELFESGEQYVRMQEEHAREIRKLNAIINRLEKEAAEANIRTRRNREYWMQVNEDVVKEKDKALRRKDAELVRMQKKLFSMAGQRDAALDQVKDLKKELYEVRGQLQDEQDKVAGLRASIKKDYTNSSKPSSTDPNHKKISNSREKTGRSRGGQKGHKHYGRKRQKPSEVKWIPPDDEFLDKSKFKPTGNIITKQIVGLRIVLDVIEYRTAEFRNVRTGQRVHAPFPGGLRDDVTYDGTVKAAAYLLNNGCNVSIGNTSRIFSEFTDGKLNLSTGMISKLQKEFSEKTEKEREEIFNRLLSSHSMHVDYTFGRCNGKTSTILICSNNEECLYMLRPKKGEAGIKDSPLEFYDGITISDHEAAFLNHGSKHQECLSHVERYAQGIIDNEPGRTCGELIKQWVKDAIHLRNETLAGSGVYDPVKVEKMLKRYDEAIEKGLWEYAYEPPTKYTRDGYNLVKRMAEDKEDYVLFLRDISVDPTNNEAERLARQYKRKNHQVITFRSTKGNEAFCDGLTIMQNARRSGSNLFRTATDIFNRPHT